jgi:hypothetical protein
MQILFVNQYFPSEAPATAYLLGELAEDLAHQHVASVMAGRPNHNPESNWFVSRDVHVRQAWSTEFRRANNGGAAQQLRPPTWSAPLATVCSCRGPTSSWLSRVHQRSGPLGSRQP